MQRYRAFRTLTIGLHVTGELGHKRNNPRASRSSFVTHSSAGLTAGKYSIWIVSPPGYPHSRCFEEAALALSEGFTELGFTAPIVTDPAAIEGTAVVLGTNLLHNIQGPLPPKLILYNLEQVQKDSPWFTPEYRQLLRRYPVWDYSQRNIEALATDGVKATLCGIGYSPGLTRIPHAMVQDIDVLFVGSVGPRRGVVFDEMLRRGIRLHVAFNVYGAERDQLVARSKIVLNLHQFEAQVFEIVRVSYLLANRVCVVSEVGRDAALESPFDRGIAFAYYGQLIAACQTLLARPDERRRFANAGFEAFKSMPQAPMLRRALTASGEQVG